MSDPMPTTEYSPEDKWQLICPRCNCEIKTIKSVPHAGYECIESLKHALAEATQWRPIETAPTDQRLILFYTPAWLEYAIGQWEPDEPGGSAGWVRFDAGSGEHSISHESHGEFTHWMPLPAPPAFSQQDAGEGK